MKNIKTRTIEFTVKVVVGCSEPESFDSQEEFDNNDLKAMRPYLAMAIRERIGNSWQHAAEVRGVVVVKKRGFAKKLRPLYVSRKKSKPLYALKPSKRYL